MTRGHHRGPTRRPSRAKPNAPTDRPPDEAEAILRDIEGTDTLDELRELQSIGNKPGKVTFRAQVQGLASFAPIFSAPDFQFGVWQVGPDPTVVSTSRQICYGLRKRGLNLVLQPACS
jgi:hypothetical protein